MSRCPAHPASGRSRFSVWLAGMQRTSSNPSLLRFFAQCQRLASRLVIPYDGSFSDQSSAPACGRSCIATCERCLGRCSATCPQANHGLAGPIRPTPLMGFMPFAAFFLPAALRMLPPGHPHLPFCEPAASTCYFLRGVDHGCLGWPCGSRVRWRIEMIDSLGIGVLVPSASARTDHRLPPRLLGFQHRRQCAFHRPGSAWFATALGFSSCRVYGFSIRSNARHRASSPDWTDERSNRTSPVGPRKSRCAASTLRGLRNAMSYPLLALLGDWRMKRPSSGA
jgi:hypothetical protein